MKQRLYKSGFTALLLFLAAVMWLQQLAAAPSNRELVIGIVQEFETLNPIIHEMAATAYISNLVDHPLTTIDADWQWGCWLCTELPTFENGMAKFIEIDGKKKLQVDWKIKPDAKWGDGKPVTGYDFKLAWEIGRSPHVMVAEKDYYQRFEKVTVNNKDPKQFTTIYKQHRYDYYQLGRFRLVPHHLEAKVWEKTKDKQGAYEKQTIYVTNPTHPGLYSGPYLIKEIKVGSHIVMTPNPHYYGKKPAIQQIVFKLIHNTQALEANLLSGTIDMACELGMTLDQALSFEKRLMGDPKLKERFAVKYRRATLYEHIDLNLSNPILKDIRVRRALMYAIDRDKLVQALFEGKQQKALHSVHPLDPYYTEDVMKYPYNPQKAGKLLEAAGWKLNKQGVREKAGKPLSLTIMTTAGDKTRELVEVFLQNEWRKVGFDIKIKNEPARVFFSETARKRNFPAMAMFAWVSSPDQPPKQNLHSSQIPTKANGFSGLNFTGYTNAKTDQALDQIFVEFDFNQRKKLMKIIQQEYVKEVPVIPLYNRAEIAVIPTNLRGFRITGHQYYSTMSADSWHLK